MAKLKVLVNGSNCFTGSHIVSQLLDLEHVEVIGVSRSPEYNSIFLPYITQDLSRFRFAQIDMVKDFNRLTSLIEDEQPQVVIHVAALSEVALSHAIPTEYFETNTLAVVKLCDFLKQCEFLEQYIHISSAEILGSCEGAIDENALFNPNTPYAVSKAAADMYLNTVMQHFDFPAALIRSTNVYGKHQQLFKIIPRTFIYLRQGKTIELHGGGKAMKSFIHIHDVVNGILKVMEKRACGTFHFSNPSDLTIEDLVRKICNMEGSDFELSTKVAGERLGQDKRYSLDCSKAKRELDWQPRVLMEKGLEEVQDWMNDIWPCLPEHSLEYVHRNA